MITLHRFNVTLLYVALTTAVVPIAEAETMQQGYGGSQQQFSSSAQLPNFTNSQNPSYGSEVGAKALNGFTNLATGVLEVPKNIINTSNQSNIFYGIIGGLFKGLVHTAGRLAVGLTDLVTFPLPTKPIAQPLYIWDDFDVDTTYGDVFRLQEAPIIEEEPPVIQAPPPVAAPQPAPVQPPIQYPDTNRKLDSIFKKEMMK